MAYAARAGYVDACPDQGRLANGELSEKEWHLMLTLEGWRHIERYDRPILHQWGANLRDNVPSIIVSIFAAVVIAWLLREFGFEK